MQEPQRINLLTVLQKNMKAAQRNIYLHRIIYIASYTPDIMMATQEARAFIISIDSNIKLINEDYCEDIITGFGLFYTGYFINIIEGPESSLVKHLKTIVEAFDKNLSKTPEVTRMKILLISYHVNKRYYSSWNGRQATPPVLLDKIEPTNSPEITSRHIQNCIMKLYRICEYLRNQVQHSLKAAIDNISDLCKAYLPEVNLLDFLLDSPALMDVREFVEIYQSMPEYTVYHETIWPLPSDFIPYNILDTSASGKKHTDGKSIRFMEKNPSEEDVAGDHGAEDAKPAMAKHGKESSTAVSRQASGVGRQASAVIRQPSAVIRQPSAANTKEPDD